MHLKMMMMFYFFTKKQGFNLSLEDTFLEKPQGEGGGGGGGRTK